MWPFSGNEGAEVQQATQFTHKRQQPVQQYMSGVGGTESRVVEAGADAQVIEAGLAHKAARATQNAKESFCASVFLRLLVSSALGIEEAPAAVVLALPLHVGDRLCISLAKDEVNVVAPRECVEAKSSDPPPRQRPTARRSMCWSRLSDTSGRQSRADDAIRSNKVDLEVVRYRDAQRAMPVISWRIETRRILGLTQLTNGRAKWATHVAAMQTRRGRSVEEQDPFSREHGPAPAGHEHACLFVLIHYIGAMHHADDTRSPLVEAQ